MTDSTTTSSPALVISEGLSDLLLWLLEDNEVEVAKEVIDKPWRWEDLARLHDADPDLSADDALEALEAPHSTDL